MHCVSFDTTFADFLTRAREVLRRGIEPAEVRFEARPGAGDAGWGLATERSWDSGLQISMRVLEQMERVAAHDDPDRWSLIYRALWHVVKGGTWPLEPSTFPEADRLNELERDVRREVYQMRAFLRFVPVAEADADDVPHDGYHVAWYASRFAVLPLVAHFFSDRFASMRFVIATPQMGCAFDGASLHWNAGDARNPFDRDDLDAAGWRALLASRFQSAAFPSDVDEDELPAPGRPEVSADVATEFGRNRTFIGRIGEGSGDHPAVITGWSTREASSVSPRETTDVRVMPAAVDEPVRATGARPIVMDRDTAFDDDDRSLTTGEHVALLPNPPDARNTPEPRQGIRVWVEEERTATRAGAPIAQAGDPSPFARSPHEAPPLPAAPPPVPAAEAFAPGVPTPSQPSRSTHPSPATGSRHITGPHPTSAPYRTSGPYPSVPTGTQSAWPGAHIARPAGSGHSTGPRRALSGVSAPSAYYDELHDRVPTGDHAAADFLVRLQECRRCGLCGLAGLPVADAPAPCDLLFVVSETEENAVVSPAALALLEELAEHAGLRGRWRVTAAVRNPGNPVQSMRSAGDACRAWLEEEIALASPTVVVALGSLAARSIFRRVVDLSRDRGAFLPTRIAPHAVATWDPRIVLRQSGPARENYRNEMLQDLARCAGVIARSRRT